MRAVALAGLWCALAPAAELVEVRRIWDQAPHNAFTDLARFKGRWYCCFREGAKHVSPDGAIRVLSSSDGRVWNSAAHFTAEADLRDPKLSVTPDERLMLTGYWVIREKPEVPARTLAWFTSSGRDWSEPVDIGDPGMWLWRVRWHQGVAYATGYDRSLVRLYASRDGRRFERLGDTLYQEGFPNEGTLLFLDDGTGLCLLRRDGQPPTALLGTSRPPYRAWQWKDLGVRVGGPNLMRLPDGRFVAGARLHGEKVRTGLCWLDPHAGTLTEFLTLPSGGDSSYPGLVFHDGLLWVSYYSSHEGKSSIYLAQVKLPPPAKSRTTR